MEKPIPTASASLVFYPYLAARETLEWQSEKSMKKWTKTWSRSPFTPLAEIKLMTYATYDGSGGFLLLITKKILSGLDMSTGIIYFQIIGPLGWFFL